MRITPRYSASYGLAVAIIFLTAVLWSAFLGMLPRPYAPFGVSGWRWVVLVGAPGGVLVWLCNGVFPNTALARIRMAGYPSGSGRCTESESKR